MAQHRDGMRFSRRIPDVSLIEQSASGRPDAEGVVIRAGDERHRGRLGLARPLRLQPPPLPREYPLEHVCPIAHLLEHGVREGRIPEPDQLARRRHGQRPQHDRIDQREDRGHPANPAGERQHRGEREPGRAPELPQRKPHVVPQLIHWPVHQVLLGRVRPDRNRCCEGKARADRCRPLFAPRGMSWLSADGWNTVR